MLNDDQITFLGSTDYFALKKQVDTELNRLLYQVQNTLHEHWNNSKSAMIPDEISRVPGKISKGYNHKGFPYQVFDYPSIFSSEGICTFRVAIWYGNYFSISLILTEKYKELFSARFSEMVDSEIRLLLNQKIWETDTRSLDSLNLIQKNQPAIKEYFEKNQSIKLFQEFNMNQINELERLCIESFNSYFLY